jgi:hypothetical protein
MVSLPREHNPFSVRSSLLPSNLQTLSSSELVTTAAPAVHRYGFELTDLFTHDRISKLYPGHEMHLFAHSPDAAKYVPFLSGSRVAWKEDLR